MALQRLRWHRDLPGRAIARAAWWSLAALCATAIPFALGVDALEEAVAAVCLGSLAIGFVIWIVAFVFAAQRTTRGDEVAVSNWVFMAGSCPRQARQHLLGVAVLTLIVTLATMAQNPFVWLANLLPLGLSALWSARHGTFPPRRVTPRAARGASRGRPSQ